MTATLWTALLDKIWIFITLAFTLFMARQKNNKLTKTAFVSNKPNKFWKLSFGNYLSEKRLDELAQTHFLQLKTPIASQYWIKLTGITYEEKFETFLKTISKEQK